MRSISEFLGIEEEKYFYINDNLKRHIILGNVLMEYLNNNTHRKSQYKINDLVDAEIKMCVGSDLLDLEFQILTHYYNYGYRYITRDKNDKIYLFKRPPKQCRGIYLKSTNLDTPIEIPFNTIFQMITYNRGGVEIDKLLKGEKDEENQTE